MDLNSDDSVIEEETDYYSETDHTSSLSSSESWESCASSGVEEQDDKMKSDGDHSGNIKVNMLEEKPVMVDKNTSMADFAVYNCAMSWETEEVSNLEESCHEYEENNTFAVNNQEREIKKTTDNAGAGFSSSSSPTSRVHLPSTGKRDEKLDSSVSNPTENKIMDAKENVIYPPELEEDKEAKSVTKSSSWITVDSTGKDSKDNVYSKDDMDAMDDIGDDDYDHMTQTVIESEYFQYTQQVWRSEDGKSAEVYNGVCTSFRELKELIFDEVKSEKKDIGPFEKYEPDAPENTPPENKLININFSDFVNLEIMKCPITSLKEINIFPNLTSLVISNTDDIKKILWLQLEPLHNLERLFLSKTGTIEIEPLHCPKLKNLTIIKNQLTCVDFLTKDLKNLKNVNLGMNDISHINPNEFFTKGILNVLNLAGNLLCLRNDVEAIKSCKTLKRLKLSSAYNGTCPVSELKYSRLIFCHEFPNVSNINGEYIRLEDRQNAIHFIGLHSNRHYSHSVEIGSSHVEYRQKSKEAAMKKLTDINLRILRIRNLNATFRRARGKNNIPSHTEVMNSMAPHVTMLENRIDQLKDWTFKVMKRLELITDISFWEENVEKWGAWLEYDSYSNIQCQLSFSALGRLYDPPPHILTVIIQLLSTLSCFAAPVRVDIKVESIFSLSVASMSKVMYNYHQKYLVQKDIPKYIGPEPLILEEHFEVSETNVDAIFSNLDRSFFEQTQETYLPEDYEFHPGIFPFPESITGCFEPPQPLFLFLMVPPGLNCTPLQYLHKFLTEKLRHSTNIQLTNCMWTAIENNICHDPESIRVPFATLIVMKVLDDCLQIVKTRETCKENSTKECTLFSTTNSVCVAPAYVLGISISQDCSDDWWNNAGKGDNDVIIPAAELFTETLRSEARIHNSQNYCQSCPDINSDSSKSSILTFLTYVKEMGDGTHADLTSIPKYVYQLNRSKTTVTKTSQSAPTIISAEPIGDMYSESNVLFDNLSKRLGILYIKTLTSLDISGNGISSAIGLFGLDNLRMLNISHNHLTTLSGIGKLPRLLEMNAKVNLFRFLISNLETLASAAPNLQTLDILPNPFQDIRDIQHIPQLLIKTLPKLTRIDVWQSPFRFQAQIQDLVPPEMTESSLSHDIMVKESITSCFSFKGMSSCCLLDLNSFPQHPPLPAGSENTGLDLDLSNNYLSSLCLTGSFFVFLGDWKNRLLKLQLQRNLIGHLSWMKGVIFPNLSILNLSNNALMEVNELAQSCPQLQHLYLCHNPLRCDLVVIDALRPLVKLKILNCSQSPLAQHPQYFTHIDTLFKNIQVIDGEDTNYPVRRCRDDSFKATGGIAETAKALQYFGDYDDMFSLFSSMDVGLNYLRLKPDVTSNLLNLHSFCEAQDRVDGLSDLPDLPVMHLHYDLPYLFSWPFYLDEKKFGYTHLPHNWSVKRIVQEHYPELLRTRQLLDAIKVSLMDVEEGETAVVPRCYKREHFRKCLDIDIVILSPNDVRLIDQYDIRKMPTLREVMLSYNHFIKNAHPGLLTSPTMYVLDSSRTQNKPENSFLKYYSIRDLHLDHCTFSTLPELPQLKRLHLMYSTYFKIQGMLGQDDIPDWEPEAVDDDKSSSSTKTGEEKVTCRESDLASEIKKCLLPVAVNMQPTVAKIKCQNVQSEPERKIIPPRRRTVKEVEHEDAVDESEERFKLRKCAPCNCLSLAARNINNTDED